MAASVRVGTRVGFFEAEPKPASQHGCEGTRTKPRHLLTRERGAVEYERGGSRRARSQERNPVERRVSGSDLRSLSGGATIVHRTATRRLPPCAHGGEAGPRAYVWG